jgi:hypothetical protein
MPEGGGPRQYRRAEVEAAIQVEERSEGGGPRQYRRAEVEAAIQVEERSEGGGPRQYKRAEVEGCRWRGAGGGVEQLGVAEGCARGREKEKEQTDQIREP